MYMQFVSYSSDEGYTVTYDYNPGADEGHSVRT